MKNSIKTPQRLFGLTPNTPSADQSESITFTPNDYAEVLASLLENIGTRNFFNGRVATSHEGFSSVLTATLIVYRRNQEDPHSPVSDFVPVWWDMECFVDEEEAPLTHPVGDDFSLASLRKLLIHGKLQLD